MTKNFTTKAAKVLTIATLSAGTLIGAIALDTTTVSASSVTQISGNETRGKIELVTNAFPTFEAAQSFMNGETTQILSGTSYQGETTPELPGTGYVVSIRINYDALTSKDQAIALANQVVAAADAAIGGTAPTTPTQPETPTEPTTPTQPEAPVTPVEPTTPTQPEAPVTPTAPITPVISTNPTTPIEVSNSQKSSTTKEEIKKVIPNHSTETNKKDVKTLPNTGDAGSVLSIIGSGLLSLGGYVALKRKN
ncbi:TPA: LPXTG cell wall anchor domain-containing protein [Streptococcus suis]